METIAKTKSSPQVVYRQAGDKYILIEYGPPIVDLNLRFQVHALMEALRSNPIPGILELSPGVRSLQINFDSLVIHQKDLLKKLMTIESQLPPVSLKMQRNLHAFDVSARNVSLSSVTLSRKYILSHVYLISLHFHLTKCVLVTALCALVVSKVKSDSFFIRFAIRLK